MYFYKTADKQQDAVIIIIIIILIIIIKKVIVPVELCIINKNTHECEEGVGGE